MSVPDRLLKVDLGGERRVARALCAVALITASLVLVRLAPTSVARDQEAAARPSPAAAPVQAQAHVPAPAPVRAPEPPPRRSLCSEASEAAGLCSPY